MGWVMRVGSGGVGPTHQQPVLLGCRSWAFGQMAAYVGAFLLCLWPFWVAGFFGSKVHVAKRKRSLGNMAILLPGLQGP